MIWRLFLIIPTSFLEYSLKYFKIGGSTTDFLINLPTLGNQLSIWHVFVNEAAACLLANLQTPIFSCRIDFVNSTKLLNEHGTTQCVALEKCKNLVYRLLRFLQL
jgi:hypothetical protein